MASHWVPWDGMPKAQQTFRGLKAYRQLPILRGPLKVRMNKAPANRALETIIVSK